MAYYNELHSMDSQTALYFYGIYPKAWDEPSNRIIRINPKTDKVEIKYLNHISKR